MSTGKTVYRLAYGDRHRGATWYDEAHRVVWLLAYGQHEFKGAGDAFPYFKGLDAEDRLLPTSEDYEELFRAQSRRLIASVPHECQELMAQARAAPGVEAKAIIGQHVRLSCAVEIVDSLEEVTIALERKGFTPETLAIIMASLFPGGGDLEYSSTIAGRELVPSAELGYVMLTELP